MKVGVMGTGFPNFEKAVNRFERHIIREVKRIVFETAEMMVTQMKALAPVSNIDGGNLRREIEVEYLNDGLTAVITSGASYSLFVEFGTGIYSQKGGRTTPWVYFNEKTQQWTFTRGMRPQPFFRPGVERGMKYFKDEMNKLGA